MRQVEATLLSFAFLLVPALAATPAPASAPQILVPDITLREVNGEQRDVVFRVALSKASTNPVVLKLSTNGTARANQDYLSASQTLSLSPGETHAAFAVKAIGDKLVENDETFFVVVSTPSFTVRNPDATCALLNEAVRPGSTPTPRPTATPQPAPTATSVLTSTPMPTEPTTASVRFVAYADTWADARERWWDMGSQRINDQDTFNAFNDWVSQGQPNGAFDYSTRAAGVVLTYQRAPGAPYFVGHISARGLKPNFVYQLKLAGKPTGGPRGAGTGGSYVLATAKTPDGKPDVHLTTDAGGQPLPINGDDWTNQQLGYVGRWWNDSNASGNTNAITDEVYQANTDDTIYGYQFIGDFVTDARGNAEANINGKRSFHITWQDWQSGSKDVFFGKFSISGFLNPGVPPRYYAYGRTAPATDHAAQGENGLSRVGLWYELQSDRPNPVVLPPGTYHCRMLITEETFHNFYSGYTQNELGGKWKTVMATEDRDIATDAPDTNPNNDIVFTIR